MIFIISKRISFDVAKIPNALGHDHVVAGVVTFFGQSSMVAWFEVRLSEALTPFLGSTTQAWLHSSEPDYFVPCARVYSV